jgi:hypothetical protein
MELSVSVTLADTANIPPPIEESPTVLFPDTVLLVSATLPENE